MSSIKEREEMYRRFQKEFPMDSLNDIPLTKYTNLKRSDSFCYWIESKTNSLGSLWGGSSYKFGIYEYARKPVDDRIVSDDKYAWYKKYGKKDAENAFEVVRNSIVEIANAARNNELEKIDKNVILGNSYKWKIAFLYSNERLVPIYKREWLDIIGSLMGMENPQKSSTSDIQKYLIQKKGEESIYEYSDKLWNMCQDYLKKKNIRYWMFAPGPNASKWNICQQRGEMCIGWDELGDFTQYEKREDVTKALKDTYGDNSSYVNASLAIWQFANELKIGDIVFAKNGLYKIVGKGIVESDYIYEESLDDYCNVRKVRWTHIGEWDTDSPIVMKTLTDITKYEDYIEKLNSLVEGEHNMTTSYQKYIDLLEANKNLILTGAPGTGKTFMAKAIAKGMGAEVCFVQFHPSYDYTDFVEGLRPMTDNNGNIGFERRDGVFKEFCKSATHNEDSNTKGALKKALDAFKDDLSKKGNIEIRSFRSSTVIRTTLDTRDNIAVVHISSPWSVTDDKMLDYLQHGVCHEKDTYTKSIGDYIKDHYNEPIDNGNKELKPFVFIIDEINRGELSKIFGELFYSIDPEYRGIKGRVFTQYQNLIPQADIFANGFYVPENVYIIGTMNDIDRSVESMDFAMRRRFTWKEVTPADTAYMLDKLDCATEAKAAMHRLNNVIEETDGLGSAYMIGPAYFLKLAENGSDFNKLWEMNIEPLLKEYLRGFRKAKEILDKFSKAYFNQINED